MFPHHQHFTIYCSISPWPILAADKGVFYVIETGDLQIKVSNGVKSTPVMLTDALHTSDMGLMVILVNYIVKADYSICFEEVGCQIRNK